jgi:hypothetical protein
MLLGRVLADGVVKLAALAVATVIWLPVLAWLHRPDASEFRAAEGIAPKGRMLAARHLAIWTDLQLRQLELDKMQAGNPEWDFMSRTYFVLALANMALREPQFQPQACEIIDAILDNTLRIEQEEGPLYFLLDYAHTTGPWMAKPERSLFVDGEIALMLGARRLVAEKREYRAPLAERVESLVRQMRQSPVMCGESYPDECWMFCNAVSLAAMRIADVLDGTDHSDLVSEWLATAKTHLVHRPSGLLIATCHVSGEPAPAGATPEGSTIWMVAHMLQIVDREFAEDQYRRARRELARSFAGFGYSREWPESGLGKPDVDSGPIVPVLEASAGASGLAIMGAAAFEDRGYLTELLTSLSYIGFPTEADGQLRYRASNPVGDAVILYATVLGPLWEEVERRAVQ